jgi:hypothetical protein
MEPPHYEEWNWTSLSLSGIRDRGLFMMNGGQGFELGFAAGSEPDPAVVPATHGERAKFRLKSGGIS